MNKPDRWLLIKWGDHYRIYSSWFGGYAASEEWKLSSRIEKIEPSVTDDCLIVTTYTGSVYAINFRDYGATGYGRDVLHRNGLTPNMTAESAAEQLRKLIKQKD